MPATRPTIGKIRSGRSSERRPVTFDFTSARYSVIRRRHPMHLSRTSRWHRPVLSQAVVDWRFIRQQCWSARSQHVQHYCPWGRLEKHIVPVEGPSQMYDEFVCPCLLWCQASGLFLFFEACLSAMAEKGIFECPLKLIEAFLRGSFICSPRPPLLSC